jgi:hypothetical protein
MHSFQYLQNALEYITWSKGVYYSVQNNNQILPFNITLDRLLFYCFILSFWDQLI